MHELPAYGPWMTPERAAALFARWAAAAAAGEPSPGLCPRCGTRLTPCYVGQQLHPLCDPDPPVWTDEELDEWTPRSGR